MIPRTIGASFSAWEGYISGRNVALEPYSKIIQKWRTTDFLDNDLDSEITISFEEINGSTKITIEHDSIPDGQPDYSQGWRDHYFTPMKTIWPDK